VDTGALYTAVPASLLRRLNVSPLGRRTFLLAEGRTTDRDIGHAWVRVDGQAIITIVVFDEDRAPALLGSYTLEGLTLQVDPAHQRLVPVPHLYLL
jgi:predicted aspartyl protease